MRFGFGFGAILVATRRVLLFALLGENGMPLALEDGTLLIRE
jgi:hypothetical protein